MKEGRVLVCYNGEWYSICSDNWSKMDAESDVVCSILGYSADLGLIITPLQVKDIFFDTRFSL